MTGIITRSHRVTCAKCTDLPKEKSCCNVARHLIAATDLHKKPAKACTRGVYNENKVKVMGSKNGFRREVDKKIAQNAKHSETSVSLEQEDLRERPAAPVYKRITRAKSKYISGTETTCNDIRGDVACNDARNTTKGKNSNTRAKEPKVHTGENSSQVDIEFGEQNQDRMIEVRMTRSKKNLLLQMQPDKENAGAGCLHGHTNEESCLADSDKNPIFTHDPTLQRKRKRMSAMMYGLGHEDSYCISEKGLGSEPQTKRAFPFRAITRSAIHKQNASATINNQTIRMDRQSSAELQNQCKEVEVTHQELTVHPKSQEKLKSCKWKDLNENMSSTGLLRKPDENSMQNDEIPLGSKDSKSSRNLRNSKSTVDKEIVNPVQVSDSSPQKKLREKVVECTMEGARRAKVIATASIPKRMTRSMQKDSLELELVQINEKPVITRKRKPQDADHPMIPRKSLRIKSQSSSVTEACTAETQLRDESCVEDDNSLKINSEEPLNSTGKLKDKDQGNSRSNDASEKLNLSESIKGVEDLQGKGHLCRISKKREKQNYDMRRKEYLTRSKHDKRSIQEDKENHLSLKAEGSTTPCYKNEPNSSSKGSGYADVAPPTDELIVLPPIESAMLDTSVRQFSVDTDSEDHLSLKRKGEAKSSLQDTSGLERTEKKSVDNQPSSPCYEKICNDIIPETPGYENGLCNSSGKLNLSENIQGLEDLAGKGHLCRIPKRKEKLKYDMPRKEYLTRSKHDKRNIQEDKEEHSSLKVEGSTTLCYKNGLNSCTKGPREVVVPPPTDVSIVLPPVESAKVDNSARQSSMDPDSGDHLKLKREGETKSSVQDTSGLEHMEKIPVDNLPSFPCYLQICNDTIPEALGNTNVVGEIQSGTPLVVSNIDQGVKSGDLAGSNGGPLKVSAHHVESSHGFDGNSYPESKRETCETTFISKIYSKPAKKSHESGVDEHDCVQQDDFIMGDANRKCFKIMTNPNDLGGRQMRPRPLDPLQPLPVFIEGRDQEFHDFNTVSFQWHPRHHGDEKFSIAAVMDSEHKSLSLKSKKQEIKIPSYRTVPDYDELRRNLNLSYLGFLGFRFRTRAVMAKKRKVVEEPVPEPEPVKTEDDDDEEEQIENGNTDGDDNSEEEEEAELSEEDVKNLLEPFSKEQLVNILCDIVTKDSDILSSIRKLADKDPAHRKVFVRGLGWDTTTATLKSVFSEYGELEECTVIMDKGTGKSKGYGFVTFKHMDAAQRALKEPTKKIDSRMTACQMACTGPTPQQPVNEPTGRKIYLSNVPADMPAEKLLSFFSKYGEVEEGPLGFDKQSGKSRGFALFIYRTAEGAKKALEEPNKNIDGHSMHCKRATENQKQKSNIQTPSSLTSPLDPNDLALTHGKGSILGSAHGVLPFNQGAAPGFSNAFNAILASQNQNFAGMNMNQSILASMNPSLASSLNPSSLSQAFSPSAQGSLGSTGSYGMHPSLGGYGPQHGGVGGVNSGVLGVYGSQASAMQGLNAYQSQQLSQSGLPRTSQAGGSSFGGLPSYLQR